MLLLDRSFRLSIERATSVEPSTVLLSHGFPGRSSTRRRRVKVARFDHHWVGDCMLDVVVRDPSGADLGCVAIVRARQRTSLRVNACLMFRFGFVPPAVPRLRCSLAPTIEIGMVESDSAVPRPRRRWSRKPFRGVFLRRGFESLPVRFVMYADVIQRHHSSRRRLPGIPRTWSGRRDAGSGRCAVPR
jgi:hypothetical protein